jgi:hypothetical protein
VIEIAARINPISYEKPSLKRLHVDFIAIVIIKWKVLFAELYKF